MCKKLSIAFIWHMHQPVYRGYTDEIYLMPWVRLHAVKDYLDMLLIMEKFPNLKLNFNFSPILIDTLYNFGFYGAHDIYSKLTVTPVAELSDDEKEFILNHFFDANYKNMVLHHEEYKKLYDKRYSSDDIGINDFSLQEYSDIMAWFNLSWIDPSWASYPKIDELRNKKNGEFSIEDRQAIIEHHRRIIRRIIPTYKKFQANGRIEISCSPYYHPILPLMLDMRDAEKSNPNIVTPKISSDMKDDAKLHVERALDRFEMYFGKRPNGMWPSEQCISDKTLQLFQKLGIRWTISDEGVLEQSLKTEFIRDFRGYQEDPYPLSHPYTYEHRGKTIDILFRDSVMPNLIGFEYPNHDSDKAANDLYQRIKSIHSKLQNSPDQNHLLTIAMDGENCWENYENDGADFLNALYQLLESDDGLETVLVSDYLEKEEKKVPLKNIHPGSWINRDFSLWVGDPTKNLAWEYLDKTRNDFLEFEMENPDPELSKKAKEQIYITEGSDWYWWYGEPNDSGQDHVFDLIFRTRLMNVYHTYGKAVPEYLQKPLIYYVEERSRYPKASLENFDLTGANIDKWMNAGCIDIPSTPTMQENRFFNKICFGCDETNLYLRFDVNKYIFDKENGFKDLYQIYIYLKNKNEETPKANIRTINKTDSVLPLLKEKYSTEVRVTFFKKFLFNPLLSRANSDNLWVYQLKNDIDFVFNDFVEIKIPFENLEINKDDLVEFFIIQSQSGIVDAFYPQNSLLSVKRP